MVISGGIVGAESRSGQQAEPARARASRRRRAEPRSRPRRASRSRGRRSPRRARTAGAGARSACRAGSRGRGREPEAAARRRAPAPAGRHGGQVGEAQRRQPALAGAEHLAGAAQPQVLLGDPEAVLGRAQHLEPGARGGAERLAVEQQAARRPRAAADPAAQLMQLGEAEALGVLDHHHRRPRARRRRPRSPWSRPAARISPRGEARRSPPSSRRAGHAAVDQPDRGAEPRPQSWRSAPRPRPGRSALGAVDQRADPVELLAPGQRALDAGERARRSGRERHGAGADRLPAGRLLAQLRDRHVAVEREHQGARDRRRGHHQQVGACALGRRGRAAGARRSGAARRSPRGRDRAKRDVVLEQRVGADHDPALAARQLGSSAAARGAALAPGQQRRARGRPAPAAGRASPRAGGPGPRSAPSARPGRRPRPRAAWRAARPASCRCRRRPGAGAASRSGRARSASISASARRCACGQRERAGRPATARAAGHRRASGGPGRALARAAPARAPAGWPAARRRRAAGAPATSSATSAAVAGLVQAPQSVGEARPTLRREPGLSCHSGSSGSRSSARAMHAAEHGAGSGPGSAGRAAAGGAAAMHASARRSDPGCTICQSWPKRLRAPLTTRWRPRATPRGDRPRAAGRTRDARSCRYRAAHLVGQAGPARRLVRLDAELQRDRLPLGKSAKACPQAPVGGAGPADATGDR